MNKNTLLASQMEIAFISIHRGIHAYRKKYDNLSKISELGIIKVLSERHLLFNKVQRMVNSKYELLDKWGHPYHIYINDNVLYMISSGKNHIFNDADDIVLNIMI